MSTEAIAEPADGEVDPADQGLENSYAEAILTRHHRDWAGAIFKVGLLFCLFIALGALIGLLAGVVGDGLSVLRDRKLDFLTSGLSGDPEQAGVWQGIKGSFYIAAIVMIVGVPLGIACAMYLEEYAKEGRLRNFIELNVRNLAGVPSIVYGLLGLAIFVKLFGDWTGGASVISGGLTLAVLVLPIVIIASAEALRSVPVDLRQAAYATGSTRWEVLRHHVLPYAAPGILTGTVLALLRAIGEAAPLILIGAITGFFATGDVSIAEELKGPFTALPMIVFNWARQPGEEWRALTSAAIIVMLAFLVLANLGAVLLRNHYENKRDA